MPTYFLSGLVLGNLTMSTSVSKNWKVLAYRLRIDRAWKKILTEEEREGFIGPHFGELKRALYVLDEEIGSPPP